ncbi:hypothetical protein LWI28_011171 [Acer negundo]|uniref:RRM domain-containing protein n=1 Tax=Acer negundo TaxID=4023 RepID=A0AAD5NVF3_ACENE|nr:hypothetical protein LWI28_011171 [Acer negundo]
MREKVRERGFDSLRFRGYGRSEDFKSKLASVYIDNLNPVMDQVGLWSFFKPFGRVRDEYLSPKNSSRRRLYAFIYFESLEEATKVARLTNDMHVRRYGDDKEKVGEKLGLKRQSRAGGWHNKCQARGRKATGKRKNETDLSSFEMSEDEIGFSNIPRKNIQEKGKKKWVPKPRQIVQREGFGKLIIGEKQGQMGKGVVSDSTLTSIDEGLISDFKRWRGECLRREGQKEGMDGIGHGLVSRDHSQGHQKISFSRSLSLDGPFKDYLENIE